MRRDADDEALQAALAESMAERDLMGEILVMEEHARQAEVDAEEQMQSRIQRKAQYVSETMGYWDLVDTARHAAEAINIDAAEEARTEEELLLLGAIVPNTAGADEDSGAHFGEGKIEEDENEEIEEVKDKPTTRIEKSGAWQAGAEGERSGELWSEDVFDTLLLFLDVTTIGSCFFVCSYWAASSGANEPTHRLWEQLCQRIYPGMLGRAKQVSEYLDVGITRTRRVLTRTKKYPMWKGMFVNRPRVRPNGVYVSLSRGH
jgi:hypothetical protein